MGNFKVGQQVVYVMRSLPEIGLIKNQVYEILDIAECNCSQNLHVGIMSDVSPFTYCSACGGIINIDDRWFMNEEGFRHVITESQQVQIESNQYTI